MTSENIRFQERGAAHKVDFPLSQKYESIEFDLATGQTNYNVATQQANAFSNFASWSSCYIRTNQDITIKLNATSNHTITIRKYESPFHLPQEIEITNIFITNASGSTAEIKILGFNRTQGHS